MSDRAVGIIGGGRWGQALAHAARSAGREALLCTRRPDQVRVENVRVTEHLDEIGRSCMLVVLAVPSTVARSVARTLGDFVDGRHLLVHAVRGLSPESLQTLSAVIRAETPVRRIGALGGPVLAEDLLERRPAVIAAASRYGEVLSAVRAGFETDELRVYTSNDLVGLEWASAIVGALSVALGYAREVGVSPGLLAALMTRAMHESARIAQAAGAEERTFFGLAGYGDLMAAVAQDDRPEVRVGRQIARGAKAAVARAEVPVRIEAFDLVPRVVDFARANGVRAPIFSVLAQVLSGELDRAEAVRGLMTMAHAR